MNIKNWCASYLNHCNRSEVAKLRHPTENNAATNIRSLSYLTIVCPILIGLTYLITSIPTALSFLKGRIKRTPPVGSKKTDDLSQTTITSQRRRRSKNSDKHISPPEDIDPSERARKTQEQLEAQQQQQQQQQLPPLNDNVAAADPTPIDTLVAAATTEVELSEEEKLILGKFLDLIESSSTDLEKFLSNDWSVLNSRYIYGNLAVLRGFKKELLVQEELINDKTVKVDTAKNKLLSTLTEIKNAADILLTEINGHQDDDIAVMKMNIIRSVLNYKNSIDKLITELNEIQIPK